MSRAAGVPCAVIYSEEYERQAQGLGVTYDRLDEMVRGAEWVIARTTLRGRIIVRLNPGADHTRLCVRAFISDDQAEVTGIWVE